MDYTEQQRFLRGSRLWGGVLVCVFFGVAIAIHKLDGRETAGLLAIIALIIAALGVLIYYAPDYLHLTVNPQKGPAWAIRIRWRIIGAVLVLGLLGARSGRAVAVVLIAVAWMALVNAAARAIPSRHVPLFLWVGDLLLIVVLWEVMPGDLLLATSLVAAAAHLAIVIVGDAIFRWAVAVLTGSALVIIFLSVPRHLPWNIQVAYAALPLVAVLVTAGLVHRAQSRNAKNVAVALRELMDFTGYTAERVRQMWSHSNQDLARNWKAAGLSENDSAALAEWYRQNSELYLFAISAYNLEYKRIRSNLKVLARGHGACLDYGAGNGEILLDLARRGHPVAYYDVPGQTMQFAQRRAQQRGLALEFFHDKDSLAAAHKQQRFDTIFSLDVLEHLPDLPGELTFLSSLLGPGGLFLFDVPAGATKAHPMHLNHHLDVVAYLKAKGLQDVRNLWQRLPFRKEEKYFFRAPLDRVPR